MHRNENVQSTYLSLLEYNAKINVHNFTGLCVNKNVGCVAISDT
jgi:hypothetical protein